MYRDWLPDRQNPDLGGTIVCFLLDYDASHWFRIMYTIIMVLFSTLSGLDV